MIDEKKVKEFEDVNTGLLQNDIISSFLKNPANKQSYLKAISDPTKENMKELDTEFKKFYFNIRFISHISSTLQFNSINFDKRQRRLESRFQSTLNKKRDPGIEGEETFLDTIPDENAIISLDTLLSKEDITTQISCPHIYKALNRLTSKQKQIINLAYGKGLTDTEIGILLGKSQQTISKTHKKALGNILEFIESPKEEGGTASAVKYI